jgi:hypothetical protein
VIDGMMDAPMHDVAASLPLADDMREALVLRHGPKGELLDSVTALEVGDDEKASRLVLDASQLYLESLIWANGAAESLFGEPEHANGAAATSAAGRRTTARPADDAQSTPPPVSTSALGMGVAASEAPVRRGFLARLWDKCRRLFGRRTDPGEGSLQGAPERV